MPIPNPELQLAEDFVEQTGCNIFLTGKAGTGKTTFLKEIIKKTPKRFIVTAPTGVAAINAGGVTLHSFFQLPFGPFVPGSDYFQGGSRAHRLSKEKRNIIKSLDLLIIDEISMVRADVLDGVDTVLRRFRRSDAPFGGVQLLMIGDLSQLSPIAKPDEWSLLQQYYDSVYFFSCNALKQTEFHSIELLHIYRQSDSHFIELLNRVRENRLDPSTLEQLNSRYKSGFKPPDKEGWITLSTHNRKVDTLNDAKLKELRAKSHCFEAEAEGEFPEYSYPAPGLLELKVGAQVMFLRNDPSEDKLYFNGKIGKVTDMDDEWVMVRCPGDGNEIKVKPATWENIKYSIDEETHNITEKKIGAFVQYPLKPAWAITIHKSQGLTFERAVIDAGEAFAHGQVYVALSRCKTFEGMVLTSSIQPRAIKTDPTVIRFEKQARSQQPSAETLANARVDFQQSLLLDCFDFKELRHGLNWLVGLLRGNANILRVSGVDDLPAMAAQAQQEIIAIGENFSHELTQLFAARSLPESDDHILDRIAKGSRYFQDKIENCLGRIVRDLKVETDNKEINKKINQSHNRIKKEIGVKLSVISACEHGFSPAACLHAAANADIDFKPARVKKEQGTDYTASDVEHPDLYDSLKDWRADEARQQGDLPHYRIMHQRVLIQIAIHLPDSLAKLIKIKGIGKQTSKNYGQDLVGLVSAYREKHNITSVKLPKKKAADAQSKSTDKGTDKGDSQQVSFNLFSQGMSAKEVAEERGLVISTIEGHLAPFVESGELPVSSLLSEEKQAAIEQQLDSMEDTPLGEVKAALGDGYSYGEIKILMAHRTLNEKG